MATPDLQQHPFEPFTDYRGQRPMCVYISNSVRRYRKFLNIKQVEKQVFNNYKRLTRISPTIWSSQRLKGKWIVNRTRQSTNGCVVGDPQILPHNFNGDPQIFIEDPSFALETPDSRGDPQILVGDPHICIGNPQIFVGEPIFSLDTPIFSLESPRFSLQMTLYFH